MKRIYANEEFYELEGDKFIYKLLLLVNQNRDKMNKETVTKFMKEITDKVRELIKTENVIGFYGDENKLYVMEFDIKSDNKNLYIQKYDEEKHDFYIEVGE